MLPVLQVGFGGFGRVHLQAWLRLGFGDRIWLADPDPAAPARAAAFNIPQGRVVADFRAALDEAVIVDVVAPSLLQAGICATALEAGKDVFVEKPLTLSHEVARGLEEQVARTGRVFQVGYYFRHHPLSLEAKRRVDARELGELRYLSGTFAGFKRARHDLGVTASDAVHFMDLFNWLAGAFPERVLGVSRDHFGRGLEDLSLVILEYPGGLLAKVESGLIQPGRWADRVMPDAFTNKEVWLCGSEGAIALDYQIDSLVLHRVRHELQDSMWRPVYGEAVSPKVAPAGPVDVVEGQFRTFLRHVADRTPPAAGVRACGVEIARLLEAIARSAGDGRWVGVA